MKANEATLVHVRCVRKGSERSRGRRRKKKVVARDRDRGTRQLSRVTRQATNGKVLKAVESKQEGGRVVVGNFFAPLIVNVTTPPGPGMVRTTCTRYTAAGG